MAMFYSAKENEAYRAVKPLVKKFYSQIVHFFDAAEHELGNMNGRQEQFAIGFIGLINHYILLACDPGKADRSRFQRRKSGHL